MQIEKNKIKKLTCLAETKFLNLYDAEYTNKGGKIKHWIIASRKDYATLKAQYFQQSEEKTDAVIIVALHKESSALVMVKQFRVPLNDYVYELPAGLIDSDEEIEKTLARELKEETGLTLLKINQKISTHKTYLSAGMTDESAALIYCTCKGIVTDEYLEEDEDIETILVSKEMAEEILKSGAKIDIKALIILHSFVKLGKALFD